MDLLLKRVKTFCVVSGVPLGIDPESRITAGVSESGILKDAFLGEGFVTAGRPFSFCGLPPGSYVLTVAVGDKHHVFTTFGVESFLVESQSVSLGPISLSGSQRLSGKIFAEDPGLAHSFGGLEIELDPLGRLPFARRTTSKR